MTADRYQEFVGKRIASIEYEDGDSTAILVMADGSGMEVTVEPTYKEEV